MPSLRDDTNHSPRRVASQFELTGLGALTLEAYPKYKWHSLVMSVKQGQLKKGEISYPSSKRVALQDAASIVGLLIATKIMFAGSPKIDGAPMPGGGMDF